MSRSTLAPIIAQLAKTRRIKGTVIELTGDKATVQIAGYSNRANIRVVGGPVEIGDIVNIEWNGFEPIVMAYGKVTTSSGFPEGAALQVIPSQTPQTGAWEIGNWQVDESGVISHDNGNYRLDPNKPSLELGDATDFLTGTGIWMGKHTGSPPAVPNTAYKIHVGNPSGDHWYWDGETLEVVGTLVGDISGTASNSFTINQDLDDANVDLIFGRTTGGNATLTYAGVGIQSDKPVAIGTTPLAQMAFRIQHTETVETYGYGAHIYAYGRVASGGIYGFESNAMADTFGATPTYMGGAVGRSNILQNAGNVGYPTGFIGDVYSHASYAGTITDVVAVQAQTTLYGGTVTAATGFLVNHTNVGATIGTLYGLKVNSMAGIASAANSYAIHTYDSKVLLNASGHQDADFQVQGDTLTHLLFVDASSDRVGVNNSSPQYTLDVLAYSGNARIAADHIGLLDGSPTSTDGIYVFENGPATAPSAYTNVMYVLQNVNLTTSTAYGGTGLTFAQSITGSAAPGITIATLGGVSGSITSYQALTVSNATGGGFSVGIGQGVTGTFTNATAVNGVINISDGTATTAYLFKGDYYWRTGTITNAYGIWVRAQAHLAAATGNIVNYNGVRLEAPWRDASATATMTTYVGLYIADISGISWITTKDAIRVDGGNVVFNDAGGDNSDFRVETNNYTHALFVDGSGDAVGINRSDPAYALDVAGNLRVMNGSNQLLLTYDGTYHTFFNAGSTGSLEIDTQANIILDPGGNNVNPGGHIEDDLGAYNVKWRTLFASELYVETLVAQSVMATIGGRIMVAPTTKLTSALANEVGPSTMYVEDQIFAIGDFLFMETAPGGIPQIEALKVTAGPSGTGPFSYTVTRGEGDTNPHAWEIDDAVVNIGGVSGEGYIDITSTQTVHQALGPTITMYVRSDTVNWNDVKPRISIGNLDSFLGHGEVYGFALGNDLSLSSPTDQTFQGIVISDTWGVSAFNLDVRVINNVSGYTVIGLDHDDGFYVTDGGLLGRNTTVFAASITNDFFGDTTAFDAGDVLIGMPFHSAGGNDVRGVWWDDSTTSLTIYSSATEYFKFSQAQFQMYAGGVEILKMDYPASVPTLSVGQRSYGHVLVSNQALYVKHNNTIWTEITSGNIYLGDQSVTNGIYSQLNATQFAIYEKLGGATIQRFLANATKVQVGPDNDWNTQMLAAGWVLYDPNDVRRIIANSTGVYVGRYEDKTYTLIGDNYMYIYRPRGDPAVATIYLEISSSGVIVGDNDNDPNIRVTGNGISFYSIASTLRGNIKSDGTFWFGSAYNNTRLEWTGSALKLYGGATEAISLSTTGQADITGKLSAASGSVVLDYNGITLTTGTGWSNKLKMYDSASGDYSFVIQAATQSALCQVDMGASYPAISGRVAGFILMPYYNTILIPNASLNVNKTLSTGYDAVTPTGGQLTIYGDSTPVSLRESTTYSLLEIRSQNNASYTLLIGWQSSDWCRYETTANAHYFNEPVHVNGDIVRYGHDWQSYSYSQSGWSSLSGTYYYKKVGKLVFCSFSLTGTSNNSSHYITIPSNIDTAKNQEGVFISSTNGAGGCQVSTTNRNRLYFFTDTWGSLPSSGTLAINGQFIYEEE